MTDDEIVEAVARELALELDYDYPRTGEVAERFLYAARAAIAAYEKAKGAT